MGCAECNQHGPNMSKGVSKMCIDDRCMIQI